MTSSTKPAVTALALCALADLVAAPALIAGGDSEASMTALGAGVAVLGVLTVLASIGVAQARSWAVPLALVTRIIDVLASLPGLGAGPGPAAAVVAITVLSGVAVVLVLKVRRAAPAVH